MLLYEKKTKMFRGCDSYRLIFDAFVDICTDFAGVVYDEAGIADTSVCSDHVFAGPVLTYIRILRAFVDVVPVETGTRTVRAQLVEIRRSRHRTRLARGSPAHRLSGNHRATATRRLRNGRRRRIQALSVLVLLVA